MSKKRILCVLLLLSILFCNFFKPQSVKATDSEVSFKAVQCSGFTTKASSNDIKSISLSFSNLDTLQTSGNLILETETGNYSININGYFKKYDNAKGYVGVFDGVIENYYASYTNIVEKDKSTRVTVDVNYLSNDENFTAITIGSAGDDIEPKIIFFGEYTDSIRKLCNSKSADVIEKRNKANLDTSQSVPLSVDAATRFQATNTKTASGYSVATVSIYYANELRNQSSMSVYAKVNSHTSEFEDYLVDVHGFDGALSSLIVYPDSWKIETVGADKYLHSNGIMNPTESTTSVTMTFPAYLPYIGFFTFNIPLTMNSVSISTRGVAVDPIYSNNIITWDVFKRYGWNASSMDGDYTTETGGCVMAGYTYEDNVTSNRSSVIGAYGAIRYEYVYTPFLGSSMTLHMWSDDAICAGSLTIVP